MGVIIILAVIMTISIASSVDNFYSVISSQLLLACFTHTCMSCIADKIRDHRAMVRPCEELAFSFEADHLKRTSGGLCGPKLACPVAEQASPRYITLIY